MSDTRPPPKRVIVDAEVLDDEDLDGADKPPLELLADVVEGGAKFARAIGKEKAADVGEAVANVTRSAPRAYRALERETRPFRDALSELKEKFDSLPRRPPREYPTRRTPAPASSSSPPHERAEKKP